MRVEPARRFIRRRGRASRQSGYALLVILLALAFLLIAMTRSAPDVAHQIKREREQELIERGTQYARAIGRYYRKFGRYPARIEELESTNNIRFLRRRYKDPMTPGGEWRFVHFGEARLGSRGGASTPGTPAGTPAGAPQSPAGGISQPGGSSPGRGSDSLSGKKFGGGPIVGVASQSTAISIRERDGKTNYNEWEFVYDSSQDPGARQGQPGRPGTPTQPGTPTGKPQQPPTTPDR
ncbi:MAG: hypothetical protein ACRD2Y_06935 [Terriglobales bacterium]